ncbi:unnamed protein product [Allacma fusca]|uniref:Vitamin K-dependent protein C n=1 Tax=Allacma fusca TaxID=39272 RepID=A0A8J2PVK4_9HEXA|nr:unnamed protein product [Allacma fusca]
MTIISLLIFALLNFLLQNEALVTVTEEDFKTAPQSLRDFWKTCGSYVQLNESFNTAEFQSFGFNSTNAVDRYDLYRSICGWNFVGSQNCPLEIFCPEVDLRPQGCQDELAISDGLGGRVNVCGNQKFTKPWKATQGGRDLFVRFQILRNYTKDQLSKARKYKGFRCIVSCSKNGGAGAKPLPQKGIKKTMIKNCACGEIPEKGGRVVGGQNATRNEFPWIATIVIPGTRVSFCGGAVINSHYVLTAAHCFWFAKIAPQQIEVLLRSHEMDFIDQSSTKPKSEIMKELIATARRIDEAEKTQRFKVVAIKNHPLFTTEFDFDVALLRLDRPVNFTGPNRTTTICLPKFDYKNTYLGAKSQVAGWGLMDEVGNASSQFLQKLEVPVLNLDDCRRVLPKSLITERMLCAGYMEGGRDSCKGDSGGPLVFQKPNKYFEQIGIVSWGKGCARENRPGFYSRVTELTQWIYYNSNEPETKWCQEI